MQLNTELVKLRRQHKGWTQQQLADIADLSLRTVQRIETSGLASNESCSALCAVLELDRAELLTLTPTALAAGTGRAQVPYLRMSAVFLLGLMLGAAITRLSGI